MGLLKGTGLHPEGSGTSVSYRSRGVSGSNLHVMMLCSPGSGG